MKEKRSRNQFASRNVKNIFVIVGMFVLLCFIIIVASGDSYKDYMGQDEVASCMKLTEYSEEGNEEGCVRSYITLTPDYTDVYGLQFQTFHMKDQDSAVLKYQHLIEEVEQAQQLQETKLSENKKVTSMLGTDNNIVYVVEDETTVYKAYGSKQTISKNQRWFDILRIDYQTPKA